jgi:YebC/PmpR family DNA-binding regulatory protein
VGGHSHWANIKHKKGAADAKRGKVWTKMSREITIAAKLGGGDPGANPRLRKAMDDAKAVQMPSDTIARAIKRGTGELEAVIYEELTYEGYAPGGVAVIVEATTDNRNRTNSEIRNFFAKAGGNVGATGCVGWMFHQKGVICIPTSAGDEDTVMSAALDLGAQDFKTEGSLYEVYTDPKDFDAVKAGLEKKFSLESAEISMVPENTVPVSEADAAKVLKLIETLEDYDDVKNVYANFDIPEQVLAKLNA